MGNIVSADRILKYLQDSRVIFGVTFLLLMAFSYQLSALVWYVIPEPDRANASFLLKPRNSAQAESGDLSLRQKIDEIRSANLFGKVEVTKAAPVEIKEAPVSSLKYKVRGIYYSEDQSLASVILEKSAKDTQFYRLGDEIDPRIFVEQIQPTHVIVNRAGKLEKLVLEKPEANMNAKASGRAATSLPVSNTTRVLQSYKRRYAKNPLALAKRFQAVPVSENGKNIGYKLKALRGEQLLNKLDIKEDDVFLAINGIGLDKPFEALDALKSLATAENASVTLLRNGNQETLNFSLK